MKCSSIGQCLFITSSFELMNVDLSHRVVEFTATLASKDVQEIANVAHTVSFNAHIWRIKLFANFLPFKGLTIKFLSMEILRRSPFRRRISLLNRLGAAPLQFTVGDDNIVQSIKWVCKCWISLIDQKLFVEFEFELVETIWLYVNVSNTKLAQHTSHHKPSVG